MFLQHVCLIKANFVLLKDTHVAFISSKFEPGFSFPMVQEKDQLAFP